MNRGSWLLCLLLLVPAAGCVSDSGSGDTVHVNVSNYTALSEGGTWEYQDTWDHDRKTTMTYNGVTTGLAGYADPVRELQFTGDSSDTGTFYFKEDLTDRFAVVGTLDDGVYHDAVPLLRGRFEDGKQYGSYEADDSDCKVYIKHNLEDDVSVEYGAYDRVVHTTSTTECRQDLVPVVLEYWFADDEGLIKWTDKEGKTWELYDRQ